MLPVFVIFDVCVDLDACDCTDAVRLFALEADWEKNLLPHMDGFSVRQSTITNCALPPIVMNLMNSIAVAIMPLKQKCGASSWSIVDGLKL